MRSVSPGAPSAESSATGVPDPPRRGTVRAMRGSSLRLIVALGIASTLAAVLLYSTVLGGAVQVTRVSELAHKGGSSNEVVRLAAAVITDGDSSIKANGERRFVVADTRDHSLRYTVVYRGSIPDNFAVGRDVIIDGRLEGGVFRAKTDTLSTKCPSKYASSPPAGL